MLHLPKLPPKPDLLKHFQGHHAAVKLLALALMVVWDWGRVAAYGGAAALSVAVFRGWRPF